MARSDGFKGLAKLGFAARGTIYLLVGFFAVLLVLGKHSPEADQRGAMQEVARHTGGFLLLWVIAIGFVGYALWRFSEAAFGVVGKGESPETGPAAAVAGPRPDLRRPGRTAPSTCWRTPAPRARPASSNC